ncbi:hypothetical protein BurJ1DRAFT_4678 [Burkholderiales bacterium JOSHI_001]|nr:hypothetical protein BurJ1DRAFT_4678 [Burkholderiales bacterium JOSHI_001]
MRPIRLELVPKPRRWTGVLALLAGAVLLGDALFEREQLLQSVAELQQHKGSPKPVKAAPKETLTEAQQREHSAARQVLQELALPWEPLLATVEQAVNADTALLTVEPDATRRGLKLVGEARHYAAVLDFMQRLSAGGTLGAVHLVNHELREDVPDKPTQFTLQATWRAGL